MVKSMTGFGRGTFEDEARAITAEIKSVNHRYSEINVKMPRRYAFAEDAIKALVKNIAPRGKIDVMIGVDDKAADGTDIRLNTELAVQYVTALKALKDACPELTGDLSLRMVATMPDVLKAAAAEEDEEQIMAGLTAAVSQAAANLDSMRQTEGGKLIGDILMRTDLIENTALEIEKYAPQVAKNYTEKLKTRIQDLLGDGVAIPEDRILLEAAVFADKSDITEEIVRLKSHCAHLRSIVDGAKEPVGKKLDFLVQEMNRESNTIGSKANDISITNHVLVLKAEIEKIREQVQNIE